MNLEEIRNRIDETDNRLSELFNERMRLSGEVARYKAENNMPISDKAREREILARMSSKNAGTELYVNRFFSAVMELSRAYQRTLTANGGELSKKLRDAVLPADTVFPESGSVACQGVEGAYSQQACDRLIPRGNILYMRTFEGVFDAVESGLCKYGVLPIDNSSNGSVRAVYDLMQKKRFFIIRSAQLCVKHKLLLKKGAKLSDVKEIYSHEQAIGQCSDFLKTLPNTVKTVPCSNTAIAAQTAASYADGSVAAIASANCAELYGLVSLDREIQNSQNNYTRFICISKEPAVYPGANRISLMLSAPHVPGALYELIAKFNALGINLTKLESYPIVGSDFEFLFFFDLEASVCSPHVPPLMEELKNECDTFVFLGNYLEI